MNHGYLKQIEMKLSLKAEYETPLSELLTVLVEDTVCDSTKGVTTEEWEEEDWSNL